MTDEQPYTKAEVRRLGFIAVAKETLPPFSSGDKILDLARKIEDFVVRPLATGGPIVAGAPGLFFGVEPEITVYRKWRDKNTGLVYRYKKNAPANSRTEFQLSGGSYWTESAQYTVLDILLGQRVQFERITE